MNRKTFISKIGGGSLLFLLPVSLFSIPKKHLTYDAKAKIIRAKEGKFLNVIGDNQTIKLTGKDTNGQLTLIEQLNPPGTMIPPHVHKNEDEVFKILEGQVEFTIGEKRVSLSEGDAIFLPRGIPHSFKVVGTKNARVTLSIFPAGLEEMFEQLSLLPAGPPNMEILSEICGKFDIRFV